MKKTMIPFVISIYFIDIFFLLSGNDYTSYWASLLVVPFIGITFVLGIVNIVFGIIHKDVDDRVFLNTMIFKIILIPHFIFAFFISICLIIGGIFSVVTIFWLASLPLILVAVLINMFSYFIVVSSSAYNVSHLIRRREGVNIIIVIITSILSIVPVIHFIDSIFLYAFFKDLYNKKIEA